MVQPTLLGGNKDEEEGHVVLSDRRIAILRERKTLTSSTIARRDGKSSGVHKW